MIVSRSSSKVIWQTVLFLKLSVYLFFRVYVKSMCEETRLCVREIKYFCLDIAECHTTSSDSVIGFSMYFSGSKICTWYVFVNISPSVGCLYFMKYVCSMHAASPESSTGKMILINLFHKCIQKHCLWKLHVGTAIKMCTGTYIGTKNVNPNYWL